MLRRYMKLLILSVLCIYLTYYVITYHVITNLDLNDFYAEEEFEKFEHEDVFGDNELEIPGYYRKLDNKSAINPDVLKYIYINHDFWGTINMSKVFNNCIINSCVITTVAFQPMKEFDAVVFSRYAYYMEIPSERSVFQKYIYFSLESPYDMPDAHDLKDFYNWSMNYRRDADIHFPHRVIRRKKTNYVLPLEKIRKKTKLIAWFVSNCRTEGTKRRSEYVEELQKYVPVDVYGRCGSLQCTHNCYEMVESDYMFYLSFENNMCFDYVSEKLFNLLRYDVIPVVMGCADYSSIVPPNSVINVDHFPTPKALSEYLLRVSTNISLYLEYMEWKKDYVVNSPYDYAFCQLCDLLHRPIRYSNYEYMKNWFIGFNSYLYT